MREAGLITIEEVLMELLHNNDDFTGTIYDGPEILSAIVSQPLDPVSMERQPHPNLVRALVAVEYLRVRIPSHRPGVRTLFLAVQKKITNHIDVRRIFDDRIIEIVNPDNPKIDSKTTQYPWLGLQQKAVIVEQGFSYQRKERVPIHLWIYQNVFRKQFQGVLTGA